MSVDLANEYLARWAPPRTTGIRAAMRRLRGEEDTFFGMGRPWEVMELMWVLNPLFAGDDQAPFREAEYEAALEGEVDALLLEWAATNPMAINIPTVGHGRVLYERHRQALVVIAANEAANTPILVPRADLPLGLRQSAVVLLWLHEMELLMEPGTSIRRPR